MHQAVCSGTSLHSITAGTFASEMDGVPGTTAANPRINSSTGKYLRKQAYFSKKLCKCTCTYTTFEGTSFEDVEVLSPLTYCLLYEVKLMNLIIALKHYINTATT